jgi:WD40 repeat protein
VALSAIGDEGTWAALFDPQGERLADVPILLDGENRADWRMAVHPTTHELLVMSGTQMKVWDFPVPKHAHYFGMQGQEVQKVAFIDQDLGHVFWRPDKKYFDVRRIRGGKEAIPLLPDSKALGQRCIATRNGRSVVLLEWLDGAHTVLHRFDLRAGELTEKHQTPLDLPPSDWENAFQLNPSGDVLWTGSQFVNVTTGKMILEANRAGLKQPQTGRVFEWLSNDRAVEVVLVQPKQKILNVPRKTQALVVWDMKQPHPVQALVAEHAVAVSASPDGRLFAEAGADGRVRIRDSATLKIERTFRFSMGKLKDVAWHPSLPLLALVGKDSQLSFWNVNTGELLESQGIVPGKPYDLEWTPDGQCAVVKRMRVNTGATEVLLFSVPKDVEAAPR